MRGTPDTAEVIRMALEAAYGTVNTACPGRVVSYDVDAQRADVKPLIRRAVPTPDEDFIYEDLPEIPYVRVIHPGDEDYAIHVPVRPGKDGLLVFQQMDPSEWSRTGEVSNPADVRRFSLAHAVFIPGYRADAKRISNATNDAVTIHVNGHVAVFKGDGSVEVDGNAQAMAKAGAVDTQLNDLRAAISGWVVAPNDGGAALKVALTTWLGQTSNVGSARVKAGS